MAHRCVIEGVDCITVAKYARNKLTNRAVVSMMMFTNKFLNCVPDIETTIVKRRITIQLLNIFKGFSTKKVLLLFSGVFLLVSFLNPLLLLLYMHLNQLIFVWKAFRTDSYCLHFMNR